MPPQDPDWSTLERLRQGFLAGTAGQQDYWRSLKDLAAYDATFAQRIGWKWDFVLEDLASLDWKPPTGPILDWGCGSGIAARAFIDHLSIPTTQPVHFYDRSPIAMDFAVRRARERFPDHMIRAGIPEAPGTVLLSHVLTELAPERVEALVASLDSATSILWVEPGTFAASLALIAIRERLRSRFHLWAPCPHNHACGILAPGNESHWCHHFADPPAAVFTDPFWGRFAQFLGIDLRSVPVSYLVLDRRAPTGLDAGPKFCRRLGRPEVNKVDMRFLGCSATGVSEIRFPKRSHPDLWRDARKGRLASRLPPAPSAEATPTSQTPAPADAE